MLRRALAHPVVLPIGLLVTGAMTTLTMKAADRNGFDHPFVQAFIMFLGEVRRCRVATRVADAAAPSQVLCLVPLLAWDAGESPVPPFLFLPPALLDVISSSLMYGGLTLTSASTYQMLRASVVPFTGLLSYLILKRKPRPFQVCGMLLVLLGAVVVGFADQGSTDASARDPLRGNAMVLLSQMSSATQLVWEEKVFSEHKVAPLRAVGLEGAFGVVAMSFLLVALNYIPSDGRPGGTFENIPDALDDLTGNGAILAFSLLGMVAVTGVNVFGVSVTQAFSASHRTVVDTLRTVIVWMFSLALGWEKSVSAVQVCGFVVLLLGSLVFNAIVRIPALFVYDGADPQLGHAREPLLA